jgi:TonB family protein
MCLWFYSLAVQDKQPAAPEQRVVPSSAKLDEKEQNGSQPNSNHGPMDILSDTAGSDVHPYLDRVLGLIKANWYKRIPDSARAPIMKKGDVSITFHILTNGGITDVLYQNSSGDAALDRAAYDGITDSSPLPSIGSDFNCKYLALKITFSYNPGAVPPPHPNTSPLIPCVRTRIVQESAGIVMSPDTVQVITGGKQQFSVTVAGVPTSAVNWKVSGSSCSGLTCGSISQQGLYTAPFSVPNSAPIIVTATSANEPAVEATATVTLAPAPTPR